MYYIRKFAESWAVHNNYTRKSRQLDESEVQELLIEFPNLKDNSKSKTLTYFRNKIRSIGDLP